METEYLLNWILVGVLVYIFFCVIVSWVADSKGRGIFAYFVLSFLLTPIVGFIVIAIKGEPAEKDRLKYIKHIFYCRNCKKTYSSRGGKERFCPNCNIELMETTVLADDWRTYDTMKKEKLKQEFEECRYVFINPTQSNVDDELKKIEEWLNEGVITKEEYNVKRKRLLKS